MKEDLERQKLISMGENPDEVLTRRKRIRQFERDKEYVIFIKQIFLQGSSSVV